MLVLSRRRKEKVFFIDRTTKEPMGSVTLVEIQHGGKVRLGFSMPDHIDILREELVLADEAQGEPDLAPEPSPPATEAATIEQLVAEDR
jgi:sRNA-binding carbon storage regulator CsrA